MRRNGLYIGATREAPRIHSENKGAIHYINPAFETGDSQVNELLDLSVTRKKRQNESQRMAPAR